MADKKKTPIGGSRISAVAAEKLDKGDMVAKQKNGKVKKVVPKEPEIELLKLDWYLEFQGGELYKTHNMHRVVVVEDKKWLEDGEEKISKKVVNEVSGLKVINGFGYNHVDAVKDFILRNTAETLNKIWDKKLEA